MLQEDVQDSGEAGFDAAGSGGSRQPGGQLVESVVGQRVQEGGMIGIVTVHRHRGNARGFGDTAHGDRIRAFLVQKQAGGCDDFAGGGARGHVYSVYQQTWEPPAGLQARSVREWPTA